MSIIFDMPEIARRMKLLDRRAVPEPEPKPAAAARTTQAQPAPYLVYFDPRSDTLTPGALSIICALPFKGGPSVLVVGHTDTVGTFIDNKILSERRAEAVQACLIRIGVPAHKIRIDSKADTDPRVPLPLNTACQENRRCEIFIFP